MMLPSIGRKRDHSRVAYPPAKPIMNRFFVVWLVLKTRFIG